MRSPRLLFGTAFTLLLICPAFAQWERVAWDHQGKSNPASARSTPHALQFYLTPTLDRDGDNSLCLGCKTNTGEQVTVQDFAAETSQHLVGESSGKKIFQIVLSFRVKDGSVAQRLYHEWEGKEPGAPKDSAYEAPPIQWKSIVMESAPNVYNELYFIIDDGVYLRPLTQARLLSLGGVRLLTTNDPIDGTGGLCTEGHWVLQNDGPWLLDLNAVHKEIGKVMPEGSQAMQMGCWALSFDKGEVRSPIQDAAAQCHACGLLGTAVVDFKIDGHRAVPVKSSFEREPSNI